MRFVLAAIVFAALAAPAAGADGASAASGAQAALTQTQAHESARAVFETLKPVGMSVAVIDDGALVYAEGFGLREIGEPGVVDADTLFPIASVTKSMTAAALAILIDEGKLGWDNKVIEHLPDFEMADSWVTREFTIRDLLTHRSGLPLGAGDLLHWPDGKSTREEVIRALRFLEPETSFRTSYAYDNLLYIVAGEVVGAASGMSYENFIEKRLFKPLGMSRCRMGPSRAARLSNRATSHARGPGAAPEPIAQDPDEPSLAAGGAVCSASDMAKWAMFLLAKGKAADGRQIVSEERIAEMLTPQTPVRTIYPFRAMGRSHLSAYALGLFVRDFEAHLLVEHGGASAGAASQLGLLPEKNAAVVVLSNDQTLAPFVLTFDLLEAAADGTDDDWLQFAVNMETESANAGENAPGAELTPETIAPPSAPLSAYAGVYRDPWYGDVTIFERGGALFIDMSRSQLLKGPLRHFNGDKFRAEWPTRSLNADAYVEFALNDKGEVVGMAMAPVSEETDFSYDYQHLKLQKIAN